MKTKENKQFTELSEDELKDVNGGRVVLATTAMEDAMVTFVGKQVVGKQVVLVGANSCPEGIDVPGCKQ